jgi:hypothetical protein
VAAVDAPRDADSPSRQTVVINLVLHEDSALAGVVAALDGLGAHIVALAKSEPSLEDVFVELVGRGFDDSEGPGPADRAERTPVEPHEAGQPDPEENL